MFNFIYNLLDKFSFYIPFIMFLIFANQLSEFTAKRWEESFHKSINPKPTEYVYRLVGLLGVLFGFLEILKIVK